MTISAGSGRSPIAPPGAPKVSNTEDFTLDLLRRGTIQAMLFDLDGTLYRQRPLRVLMALELLTLPLGGPFAAPRRLRALQAFRRAQEALRSSASAGGARIQFETAASASGLPVAEVEQVVTEWMVRRPLKYLQLCRRDGLLPLLDAARQAGLRLGILSDYPAEDKLAALGLSGRFSPVLGAADPAIGAFKPSPRGYLRACEIWGLEPSAVLYLGDRAEVDAAGAAAAGMPCVIIGARGRADDAAAYARVSSFERLTRVLDAR